MLYNWSAKSVNDDRNVRSISSIPITGKLSEERLKVGAPNLNREEYQDKQFSRKVFNIIFIVHSNVKIDACQLLVPEKKKTSFSHLKIKITLDIDILLIIIMDIALMTKRRLARTNNRNVVRGYYLQLNYNL